MANSLLTGVTGLRANQEMLDVVGNNLANANTTAFKSQRVHFEDLVYQTLHPATAARGREPPTVTPQGTRTRAAVGPLAQGLTSPQPYRPGGVAATAATL